ncbi:hypothetical protein [Kamptonema sp. UHCC 0994]|uniref:hypothetical protein n=1 Tax=Kamptonema sp. UHCC 0994 TaxID=3031329 RepID=UPI0023B8A934|nr:hypothetical protein [Kamptonema sp. UHCC 0994]MDF0553999.1 hypothetical protein [Kamptonema sp. UHCC 0994]
MGVRYLGEPAPTVIWCDRIFLGQSYAIALLDSAFPVRVMQSWFKGDRYLTVIDCCARYLLQ